MQNNMLKNIFLPISAGLLLENAGRSGVSENWVILTEATSVSCELISTRLHSRMSCMRLYIDALCVVRRYPDFR